MGQGVGTPAGCSYSTLHLCATEDGPNAALVLPSRCSSASSSQPGLRRISRGYSLDPTSAGSFPGSGAFSTALKAVHRASGDVRVIRIIPRRRCDRERLVRELEVLRGLDHPNLARVCEFVTADDSKVTCLCMEHVAGKDLLTTVAAGDGGLRSRWPGGPEALAVHLLRQILLALQHLHGAGVTHEDVQPRNILLSEGIPGQELRVKLIDYGLAIKHAKVVGTNSTPALTASLHRSYYCIAPEQATESMTPRGVMLTEPAVDIWAAGAIAFFLISGHWPFEAETPDLLRKKIRMAFWSFLPAEAWTNAQSSAKTFVKQLMSVSVAQRPSATQALANQFLSQPGGPQKPPFAQLAAVEQRLPSPKKASAAKWGASKQASQGGAAEKAQARLTRLAARTTLLYGVVDAMAVHLTTAKLEDFRRYFSGLDADATPGSKRSSTGFGGGSRRSGPESSQPVGAPMTLDSLRRALMQAGVALPGRLLSTLLITEQAEPGEGFTFRADELADAALERRRGLEEALLWVAWSCALPDGAVHLRKEELPKLVELGGPTLAAISGASLLSVGMSSNPTTKSPKASSSSSFGADCSSLPAQATYDELLVWLQSSSKARPAGSTAAGRSNGAPAWLKTSPCAAAGDLCIRMPAPPDPA